MRGKLYGGCDPVSQSRLIPAGAGKTASGTLSASFSPAHPRRCGENYLFDTKTHEVPGSSPQVRGKLRLVEDSIGYVRLIPAGAGKTYFQRASQRQLAAHPRRCGENHERKEVKMDQNGSSPQVRGKPNESPQLCVSRRLIPAGAGKTRPTVLWVAEAAAHPRRCGENRNSTVFRP